MSNLGMEINYLTNLKGFNNTMKIFNNIIGFILTFTIFGLFFLKQEYRTPELSLFIFAMILCLLVNKFLMVKVYANK